MSKCPIHGDDCPGDDGGFFMDGNHPDDMFGVWDMREKGVNEPVRKKEEKERWHVTPELRDRINYHLAAVNVDTNSKELIRILSTALADVELERDVLRRNVQGHQAALAEAQQALESFVEREERRKTDTPCGCEIYQTCEKCR